MKCPIMRHFIWVITVKVPIQGFREYKGLITHIGLFYNAGFCLHILMNFDSQWETSDLYEGQSKITEPYLITFESSKMDIYLNDISL